MVAADVWTLHSSFVTLSGQLGLMVPKALKCCVLVRWMTYLVRLCVLTKVIGLWLLFGVSILLLLCSCNG